MTGPAPDHYALLGLTRTATAREVTQAYRRLVRRLHPDTRQDEPDGRDLEQVIAAYAVLRDATRRAEYDRQLAATPTRTARPRVAQRPGQVFPEPEPFLWAGPVRFHGPSH